MKYIVNLSGGLTSAWALKCCIEQKGIEHTEVYFANTKGKKDKDNSHAGEDEDSYRFIKDLARHFQIPIHVVADGRDIWQVMKDKRAIKIPQQAYAPCSKELKANLLDRVIFGKYAPNTIVRVFGMQWFETNRMDRLRDRMPCDLWFPLANPPYVDKEEIKAYFEANDIKQPRLYDMGFEHNNCGGFCVKAGKAHFARLYFAMPERYLYHEQKEQELCDYLGKKVTILTEQVDWQKHQLSLREFRERLDAGDTRYDPNDFGGCGCFLSGTEKE